ncbi:MAG: hypothetical protein WC938_02045 [Candidatus Paceibacterota bacterium]|jgi:hypothetical protein
MNKDILFIIVIFILVVLGIYFVFINGGLSDNHAFNILNGLEQETQIDFSSIKEDNFTYKFESGDQSNVSGYGFYALGVNNESSDAIRKYFDDNEFKIDFFEIENDLSGISYCSKGKDACIIKTTVLMDGEALNKLSVNVVCGELAN